MDPTAALLLDAHTRADLWRQLAKLIEEHLNGVRDHRVAPVLDPAQIREELRPFTFDRPLSPQAALEFAAEGLWRHQVHPPHPGYYGLFNPATTPMSIAGDALTAVFNPQLATWSHSPFAVEVEQHLTRAFAAKFGYDPGNCCGTFATAGTEANHTAVLTALTHAFPEFARGGLRALPAQPTLYIPAEAHHSVHRAARLCGLGSDAIREIPADDRLQMDVNDLEARIAEDRRSGFLPFFVAATAGTTNEGIIDPLPQVAEIAERERLWLHVDAAWGGAAVLVPEFRPWVDGIERADSITFDAHKWLQVPMGAGLFLSRHADILDRTFRTTAAYMPREAAGLPVIDPYTQSMQWSRRFIGLKLFLSLAVAGWAGYEAVIRRMVAMGRRLRERLDAAGWDVVNDTPLPLACFVDRRHAQRNTAAYIDALALAVVNAGRSWISSTRVAGARPVLRACITNYRTEEKDIVVLIEDLEAARSCADGGRPRRG
jgi:glutamate/tyrosine decarboxylase-like PLP-dependent enzyme